MKAGRVIAVVVLVVLVLMLGASIAAVVVFPQKTADLLRPLFPDVAESVYPSRDQAASAASDKRLDATSDADMPVEAEQAVYREAHKGHPAVNPIVAQCDGIDLHTPVDPADLTTVLFHQASYDYGLVMTTQLPEADLEVVGPDNPARVNADQMDGEWLDADVLHLWRSADNTEMDTSIDIGAEAGTVIRAPVTGTVVLVKDYMLYDELPDIEIHIQPDGRPDLDVVLIHTEGALVKAGDRVVAGVTEVAHVRDIASALTDVQLGFYTEGDDPGNHTHLQVNDANSEGYREKKLEGAVTVR